MNEAPRLAEMLRAIAAGHIVDRETADGTPADESTASLMAELKVLSRIAEVHGNARRDAEARDIDDGPLSSWGPLTILECVGRGSYGDVYRAWDTRLDREVALKLLRRRAEPDASPVIEEGRLLARVRHPNAVTVYGADRIDGRAGIWMEFIEGRTLDEELQASGPFSAAEVAALGTDICRALDAVHSAGVVHRDVKAQNVMREATGRIVLMDFGSGLSDESGDGVVGGTPLYLAPEVLDGRDATIRSDVYAVGVLLYHLLTGRYPVEGSTLADVRARHRDSLPVPLRGMRPGIPKRLSAAIERAIARDPAARYDSAATFEAAMAIPMKPPTHGLRRYGVFGLAATILMVIGALAAGITWVPWNPVSRDTATIEIRTLAILPFQMLGPIADADVLELGLADGLITRLSSISGLTVRPIATVRQYKGATADPMRAARELQVDAIVEGTLQPSATGLRANVRLLRAKDGGAQWAGTIESDGARLLTLEESIARQIALNIDLRLTESERGNLETRRRVNPEAHEHYVRGRFEWGKRTREGFERAADYFRRAIDLEPTYARAYVGLADCFLLLGGYNYYPQLETLPKAKALALRALELDPSLGEAHATLGLIAQNLEWDWESVEKHYRQAIALAPNYATGHHWYAEFLSIVARFDESRRAFAQARRIDPISPIIQVDEAQLYLFERQFDRSRDLLERAGQTDPGFDLVHERIALIHVAQGRHEEAWERIQRIQACRETASDCYRIWTAYLPARNAAAARDALLWLEQESSRRHIAPFVLVQANARQGRNDRALQWLEHMLEKHEVSLITMHVNPLFDPLRTERRFARVLEKLDLRIHASPAPPSSPPERPGSTSAAVARPHEER